MKFKNADEIKSFMEVLSQCTGKVWLTSVYGDKYNLNSSLSQYLAIGAMLGEHGDELELFAEDHEDEVRLYNWIASTKKAENN